jgi:hypothetical protein
MICKRPSLNCEVQVRFKMGAIILISVGSVYYEHRNKYLLVYTIHHHLLT